MLIRSGFTADLEMMAHHYYGSKIEILVFFELGHRCYPHLKFHFEVAVDSKNVLDTTVYKGGQFQELSKLDIKSYIKHRNTFQYLHNKAVSKILLRVNV